MMDKLIVSSSPHITGNATTRRIMLDVIIALLPASIASVVLFGPICLAIIALSIIKETTSKEIRIATLFLRNFFTFLAHFFTFLV